MPAFSEGAEPFPHPRTAPSELPFLAPTEIEGMPPALGEHSIILSGTLQSEALGERSWSVREGLKLIGGLPVAAASDMTKFEQDVLGKSFRSANAGVRVMNALRQNYVIYNSLDHFSKDVLKAMRFYTAKEDAALPGQDFTYVELLSLTKVTQTLIDQWRGRWDFSAINGLNARGIQFMARFLNHTLRLEPPLETYSDTHRVRRRPW